jgi:hypothetical protein
MFIGHTAIAFAAKKAAPQVRFGTLLFAALFADLLFPMLVLFGVEHVMPAPGITAFTPYDFYDYPISHSLVTNIAYAYIFASIFFLKYREWSGALVLAGVALSHWVLDFISHRPDMPLVPGSQILVGLGLWNSVPWTVILESGMFVVGVYLYLRTTTPADSMGSLALWLFIGLEVFLYIGDIFSNVPVDGHTMALFSLTQWFVIPWGYWIDRHRLIITSAP